jgi:hypothetical protein
MSIAWRWCLQGCVTLDTKLAARLKKPAQEFLGQVFFRHQESSSIRF